MMRGQGQIRGRLLLKGTSRPSFAPERHRTSLAAVFPKFRRKYRDTIDILLCLEVMVAVRAVKWYSGTGLDR